VSILESEATPGPAVSPSGGAPTAEAAWEVLERFGQALQLCDQAGRQIRLLLEATQESLGADAVFWYPGATSDRAESVGTSALTPEWAREFTERLLPEAGAAGQLVRNFLDPGARPMTPWPVSAALVRVSSSRSNWMGALSFHPRRLFRPADLKVMLLARRMVLNHRQQAHTYEKLKESLFGLVRCLTAAIDAKDPYTWGHSERVARIAVRLGREMGMPAAFLSDLYLAGLLHDIGKIGIRDSVLQKAGKLTDEEYDHIKEHPLIGDKLVSNVKTLQHLRPGVRNHHERFDGQGYPDRLAGEVIPLQARVLAVADACDAMMAARPYRPALPPERIDAVMAGGAGSQWDPRIIEHFQACRHELYSICQRGIGESVVVAVERALRAGGGSADGTSSQKCRGERTRGS
jgi:HD-GYP domain-containing protein (c-di-GMP phosphodiesterase class II)